MELLTGGIIIITAIGALVMGAGGLVLIWKFWYFIIPLIGFLCGGFFGLCFGLGLVAIIGIIVLIVQSQ